MSAWLKAGLIGAAVVAVLNVGQALIPCLACITWLIALATYGAVGALAAYWIPPVRMTGPAAGQGALAGLIAAAIGTGVGVVASVLRAAVVGPAAADLSQIPPEVLRGLSDAGIDPGMLVGTGTGVVTTAVFGIICCGVSLAIGAALGALGGLIFAAVKSE